MTFRYAKLGPFHRDLNALGSERLVHHRHLQRSRRPQLGSAHIIDGLVRDEEEHGSRTYLWTGIFRTVDDFLPSTEQGW